MIGTLILQNLSPEHMREHMPAYTAISVDVSSWTVENFLKELPRKWELSFALWEDEPVAYCIMSLRNGRSHINQFMVAPTHRGDGIGSAMLAEAVKRGAETLKVDVKNLDAIRFYRRHGFCNDDHENGYLVMRRMAADDQID